MKNEAIALDARFTDTELAAMFTVDCAPSIEWDEASRSKNTVAPYVFNDIKVPLWTITKRTPSRGERAALQSEDHIRDGISDHAPGSEGRVADLARYYGGVEWDTEFHDSAFEG